MTSIFGTGGSSGRRHEAVTLAMSPIVGVQDVAAVARAIVVAVG